MIHYQDNQAKSFYAPDFEEKEYVRAGSELFLLFLKKLWVICAFLMQIKFI